MHSTSLPFPNTSIGGSPQRLRFHAIQPVARRLSHLSIGWLATAALCAVLFIGVYPTLFNSGGHGGGTTVPAAVIQDASPEANPVAQAECTSTEPYFGCGQRARLIGLSQVFYPNIDKSGLASRQVQLQGWAVAPGASIAGVLGGATANGVVIDVVLSGAYVATFDVPVVVARGGVTNDVIEYLDAGVTVELGRFDTVSYQLGGLRELLNPLGQLRIEFKRAVIYEGDISAFSTTTDGVTANVEGDAELPRAIGYFGGIEATVELYLVDIVPGTAFPPPGWEATFIGPVDSQTGPAGQNGFVLVISQSRG